MVEFLKKIHPRIYIALSGILLGFTVIFAEIGLLAYVALIPLGIVFLRKLNNEKYRVRSAYLDGFIFYMCFDLVGFHWFTYFYPLEFTGMSKVEAIVVIILAWIGLSLLQSVFSAFSFALATVISRTDFCKKYPISMPFVIAALFAVNEWTQTFTWAGVPWSRIAISQTEMPLLVQNASLFGSYFTSFTVVLFNMLAAFIILRADKRKLASIVTLCLVAANLLTSTVLYFVPTEDTSRSIKVAAVQGNLESQSNYNFSLDDIYEIYSEQSKKAAEDGAELIIWPEGTFNVPLNYRIYVKGRGYIQVESAISALAQELGVTIVAGSYVAGENESYYNGMSAFYPDGDRNINAYSKIRLVPFGEFLPMKNLVTALVPMLGEINMLDNDITPGESSTVFDADKSEDPIKIGTLICFDSIYEELAIDSAREGAEVFIVPSNDSWFYDSRALNMHHSQNILRAVEQGKYTVNCGNTGITSIVSDKGEIVSEMPIYQEGYVLDTVYASGGRTLYSYVGNIFCYLCLAFLVLPLFLDMIPKRKKDL